MSQRLSQYEVERYGRNKKTSVDRTSLKDGSYSSKFKNITSDPQLNRLIAECAREILAHRSGTEYEDMYWISVSEKRVVCKSSDAEKNSDYEDLELRKRKVWYTDNVIRIIDKYKGDLITIHNHPGSLPPSAEDFTCNYIYGYVLGLTIGHNGNDFKYSSDTEISAYRYRVTIADIDRTLFDNEIDRRKEAIKKLISKGFPITCEEV